MSSVVLTPEEAKKHHLELVEAPAKGRHALHEVIVAQRAARRSGTASSKTKAEVSFTGAKPWRQKGTGRARAGYFSSVIRRSGGVVFGPKPRDYSKTMPKKVRQLAFRKALSERIQGGDVLVVEGFEIDNGKTKDFLKNLQTITPEKAVLLISDRFSPMTLRAAHNVKPVRLSAAKDVNVEQLLYYKKIILTTSALEPLSGRTSR